MSLPRNKPLVVLFVVLALAAGLAGFLWRNLPSPAPAPRQDAAAAPAPSLPEVATIPSQPLPPAGQPLGKIVATLRERADAGDRAAACRLGVELLACEQMGQNGALMKTHLDLLEQDQAGRGQLDIADRAADMQLAMIERERQCALASPGQEGESFRYLRQAALAGEPDALLLYAGGHMFSDFGHLQHPGFDTWRREAPGLIQREFRRGNTDMALQLGTVYGSDANAGAGLFRDDPFLDAAHSYLVIALLKGPAAISAIGPLPTTSLSDADREKAMALARRWHAEHFGSRVYPREARMQERSWLPIAVANLSLSGRVEFCGQAPAGQE